MTGVLGVAQDFEQIVIAVNATAIFWRTGVRAGQTNGALEHRIARQYLFSYYFMLPVIAEIIFVNEFLLRDGCKVGHCVTSFVQRFAAYVIEVRVGHAEISAGRACADSELVQM